MINKLSSIFLSKHANTKQQKALNILGNSDYDPKVDKLGKKYNVDTFEGSFKDFKNSDLADIFDNKELKALFNLIDINGDGNLSAKELRNLAKLGNGRSKNKIDDSDLKALFKTAEKLADEDIDDEDVDDDGYKTVTKYTDDGAKIVKKYDEDGELVSLKKIDEEGNISTTSYVNGKKEKTIKENIDGSQETIRYDKKGRKKSSVLTNEDGSQEITRYKNGKKVRTTFLDENGEVEDVIFHNRRRRNNHW